MNRFMMGIAITAAVLTTACGGKDTGVVEPPPCDTCGTQPPPPPPPPPSAAVTLALAGNIAACNGNELATARLITDMGATTQVIALGDNDRKPGTGGIQNYDNCYSTSWGLFKANTRAAVGNHEYDTTTNTANGHATYWGANQGEPGKFWQAYDVGAWRVIILNVTDISTRVGASYGAGSEQMAWLATELAANTKKCTLVALHNGYLLSSHSNFMTRGNVQAVMARLYNAGVDVVVSGNEHRYERFAQSDASGNADATRGIYYFNVGTGGESVDRAATEFTNPLSQRQILEYGVLKLTLKADSFDFAFMNAVNTNDTDSGSGTCH